MPTGFSATAPRGTMACLRFAASSAGPPKPVRAAKPARIPAIRACIASSSSSSTPANRATTSVGQVVRGRAEPAAGDDELAAVLGGALQGAGEVVGPVADQLHVRHLEPERAELAGEPRTVAVGDGPGQQLAPGDDDGSTRPHSQVPQRDRIRIRL